MSTSPRFARKETRDLAKEAEAAGFVYSGDDSKGHARYVLPTACAQHNTAHCEKNPCSISFAETPRSGQIKQTRTKIRALTGAGKRGSYDPRRAQQRRDAAKQRERDTIAAANREIERIQAARDAAAAAAENRRIAENAVKVMAEARRNGIDLTREQVIERAHWYVSRDDDREMERMRSLMRVPNYVATQRHQGRLRPRQGRARALANMEAMPAA